MHNPDDKYPAGIRTQCFEPQPDRMCHAKWIKLLAWKVGDSGFEVSKKQIVSPRSLVKIQ